MLSLRELQPYYPENLHRFPRFIIREYMQYKILEIIFESRHATDLCFLGGTCLRTVHGNRRFSEDLDFDNISLNAESFEVISGEIRKGLQREGYQVELKTVMKGAWHCYIKIPDLLYDEGLSGYKEEKILIQLDTEPQDYEYEPETFILNRFEVFTTILTTPLPLLMAQKLYAIVNRNRNKGRDFYDVLFLMGRDVKPDFGYLQQKISVSDVEELKKTILKSCQQLNMDAMATDVEPFLFDPSEMKKVRQFEEIVRQYQF
ncbi:MAG: nucleotidyl transferase AbiEii/AbiGii toxin family protein [Bacteroidetes bacterium]|jgi:predicted nucleotidyltransferase component of viral defense system|nr:nucleotidyl transferase AbiEii/AbiGii toxin family protein [Bacteroidota bacterium]